MCDVESPLPLFIAPRPLSPTSCSLQFGPWGDVCNLWLEAGDLVPTVLVFEECEGPSSSDTPLSPSDFRLIRASRLEWYGDTLA